MNKVLKGRVWKFGDNIDTDIITPADTTSWGLADHDEYRIVKENAFRPLHKDFYKLVQQGDILVAGRNFGLGSHREQANVVLKHLGFTAVVAESIARLYFRNSVAIAFPAFQVPGITGMVEEGDILEIDTHALRIRNITRKTEVSIKPISPLIEKIFNAGGILEMMKDQLNQEQKLK